jgi:hypothetical protein
MKNGRDTLVMLGLAGAWSQSAVDVLGRVRHSVLAAGFVGSEAERLCVAADNAVQQLATELEKVFITAALAEERKPHNS